MHLFQNNFAIKNCIMNLMTELCFYNLDANCEMLNLEISDRMNYFGFNQLQVFGLENKSAPSIMTKYQFN